MRFVCYFGAALLMLQSGAGKAQPAPTDPIEAHELAFFHAIMNGDVSAATRLLKTPYIDVNSPIASTHTGHFQGATFLTVAAWACNASQSGAMVDLLLKNGADPNKATAWEHEYVPLGAAYAECQDDRVFLHLLKAGADPNQLLMVNEPQGTTVFSRVENDLNADSTQPRVEKELSELLTAGYNANRTEVDKFNFGGTGLVKLLNKFDLGYKTIKFMLSSSTKVPVDVNLPTQFGWTPLDIVRDGKCPFSAPVRADLDRLLVSKGARTSGKPPPVNCDGYLTPSGHFP